MKNRTEKDRISAVLFIVVFLLVVVIVIMVLKTVDDKRAAQQAQEQTTNTQNYQPPVETPSAMISGTDTLPGTGYDVVNILPTTAPSGNQGQAPAPAPANNQTPAPAPANNQTPAASPAPEQEPPAEPTPVPAPVPVQTPPEENHVSVPLGSGSFESDSGTWLNIHADWSAKTISATQVEVVIIVYCDHQSLFTGILDDSVGIALDDVYTTNHSPAIQYASNDPKSTELGRQTFTVDLAQGESRKLNLSVAWGYGGTYGSPKGRVQLDSLECGGVISLSR